VISVAGLYYYPLKSVQGLSVDRLSLDKRGPVFDRRWMLVDQQGQFLTQRSCPTMGLVQAKLNDDSLELSTAGRPSISLPIQLTSTLILQAVEVWGDQVEAVDCGDAVARWWSDYLDRTCRMVFMPESFCRPVYTDQRNGPVVSFADRYPLLLCAEASLADLNKRLDFTASMARFRPNIVVQGCQAFAEDSWQRIRIGEVEFSVEAPCARCGIPALNPHTAKPQPSLLTVLNQYRRSNDGQVYFGQNLIHQQQGVIERGQGVEILA
jgi:uncharacterized protein YcbX